jgi:hypothetical protein
MTNKYAVDSANTIAGLLRKDVAEIGLFVEEGNYNEHTSKIVNRESSVKQHIRYHSTISEQVQQYFRSQKNILVFNILVTSSEFFLIAKRVETFSLEHGIIADRVGSFGYSLDVTFWTVRVLLELFISTSLVTIFITTAYRIGNNKNDVEDEEDKRLCIAAIIDYIISGICLIIFFVAESQRCCTTTTIDHVRFLGAVKVHSMMLLLMLNVHVLFLVLGHMKDLVSLNH